MVSTARKRAAHSQPVAVSITCEDAERHTAETFIGLDLIFRNIERKCRFGREACGGRNRRAAAMALASIADSAAEILAMLASE